MKVLVITGSPWREDNSIGNSYSNLFGGIENIEIANIYLKNGKPDNNVVSRYFQITEKKLIANLLNKKRPSGRELSSDTAKMNVLTKEETKIYNVLRTVRMETFFTIRELIWKIGRWKSVELNKFLDDFQPDIIFSPLQKTRYMNNILMYIKEYTQKPLITYAWDDVYSLNQISYSPIYWINRFLQRAKIRKVAKVSEFLYVISEFQKLEYEKFFNKECKVLFKGYTFKEPKYQKSKTNVPIQVLYTGNIASGRWKVLQNLGEAIKKINLDGLKIQLNIYTLTPVSEKIKKSLNIDDSVYLKGGVSSKEVKELQKKSDILVHVEPFKRKDMLISRLSFSTKLVDYFYSAKCILAIGEKESASINYLLNNDAAIVVTNETEIIKKLNEIVEDRPTIEAYAKKAWSCGERNHQISIIQKSLYKDFLELVKG